MLPSVPLISLKLQYYICTFLQINRLQSEAIKKKRNSKQYSLIKQHYISRIYIM